MSEHAPNEVDIAVGRALTGLRTRTGWTVVRLASQIEVTVGALVDAEAGRRRLTAAEIMAASRALGFAPRDLYMDLGRHERSFLR